MGIYDRDYYQDDQLRPLQPWDNRTAVTMIIFVNVVVHVANFLIFRKADNPLGIAQFLSVYSTDLFQPLQWYRFLTYGFTHDPIQITHILFNMVSLYFLGRNVEDKFGKWEFLRFYLVAIVLGGVFWAAMRVSQDATLPAGPLMGASGGTTAVAMLFVFSFPQATLYLYGALPVKAWLLGIIIVLGNVFGSTSRVAYDVHLVGAAFAAVYFYGKWNFGRISSLWSSLQASFKQNRSGLKVHRPDSTSSAPVSGDQVSSEEAESDRILDKIHNQGKDSLSARERAFMETYSRQMREKRKQT